ncbi:OLC1v1015838C1 [Oldenlandia corymbosa var. corymbosa]|uniref:OLC1v1015838C1 n=1 Tax=Oldenlandia corymbosa var. corymbosa TaxID=529605 RepID=A0AAV1E6B4_OLDCO|nr:OLC1v1015838C1 [Oldenlandia corymbosa var. corymbosa]
MLDVVSSCRHNGHLKKIGIFVTLFFGVIFFWRLLVSLNRLMNQELQVVNDKESSADVRRLEFWSVP